MGTLRDSYNTGEDYFETITSNNLRAQTFTTSVSYSISSVKLKLSRYDTPGTITVSIKATVSNLPSGADLCSGTTNADTLVVSDVTSEWREIIFSASYTLAASTKYAIVVGLQNTGADGTLNWWEDTTAPTYTGGNVCYGWTDDWYSLANYDFMFETYSGKVFPTLAITRVTSLIHRYNRNTGEYTLEIGLGEVDVNVGMPSMSLITASGSVEKSTEQVAEQVVKDGAKRIAEQVTKAVAKTKTDGGGKFLELIKGMIPKAPGLSNIPSKPATRSYVIPGGTIKAVVPKELTYIVPGGEIKAEPEQERTYTIPGGTIKSSNQKPWWELL